MLYYLSSISQCQRNGSICRTEALRTDSHWRRQDSQQLQITIETEFYKLLLLTAFSEVLRLIKKQCIDHNLRF